jgi:hypothetical protein
MHGKVGVDAKEGRHHRTAVTTFFIDPAKVR